MNTVRFTYAVLVGFSTDAIMYIDMDEKGIRLAFDTDNECSGFSSFSGDNDVCNMFLDEFYSGDFVVSVNGKEVEGTDVRIDDEGLSIVIPKPYAFLSRHISIRTRNYNLICDAYINKISFQFVVDYQAEDMPVEARHSFITVYYCSEQEWKNTVATTSEAHVTV